VIEKLSAGGCKPAEVPIAESFPIGLPVSVGPIERLSDGDCETAGVHRAVSKGCPFAETPDAALAVGVDVIENVSVGDCDTVGFPVSKKARIGIAIGTLSTRWLHGNSVFPGLGNAQTVHCLNAFQTSWSHICQSAYP
jgi:hypothetical protein